ncbi:MAG TPA: hypothetical protein VMI92_11665 [Steroidobacteraceae bacterium]|nr:hypothetical protein [Steroidobacteraceae bacterium]
MKTTIGRDILGILALKAVLIAGLYLFLVRPSSRPSQDAQATAAAVTGASPATSLEVSK